MMLRNGHRLCRSLYDGCATRWRFFSSAKSFSSQHADVNVVKREADDAEHGEVPTVDQTRSWKAVVQRPKTLTREPFVKNLFLGKFDTVSRISPNVLIFGWSFVKRFALCYRTIVCPVVCNVGVLWPNSWMHQDETWHRGRPWPRLLTGCGCTSSWWVEYLTSQSLDQVRAAIGLEDS